MDRPRLTGRNGEVEDKFPKAGSRHSRLRAGCSGGRTDSRTKPGNLLSSITFPKDKSPMPTRRTILRHLFSAGTLTAGGLVTGGGLALPTRLFAQGDPPSPGKKVAFLVGVDKYLKPGFSPLNCCERDVLEVAKELKSLGFGPIEVLLGSGTGEKQATKANIEPALETLVKSLGQDDLIMVMLSGHGQQFAPDPKAANGQPKPQEDAFFCPVDAVNRTAETLVSLSYVTDQVLANNVGKRLVLVDACRDMPPKDPNKGAKGIQGRQITLAEDTGVFFSCRAGQQSFTNDELNHSLFTYCVLEALRGKGAAEGVVTWDGLVNQVKNQMATADIQQRIPEGKLQSPISAGSVDRTVLGRIRGPAATGTRAGEERDDNGLQMKFVWCPAGTFTMGSPKSEKDRDTDEDQVQVTLTQGFWLGKYEVTQGEWQRVMGTTPWKGKDYWKEGPRYAASYISWDDAREFVKKLTAQERQAGRLPEGWEYTLPTEAQWEYACRAGTKTAYSFGDAETQLSDYAWWGGLVGNGNAEKEPYAHEVGGKKPNAWGLHDLHGNVWEWCLDGYKNKLPGGRDPLVAQASRRVDRGGGWNDDPSRCRSACRGRSSPGNRNRSLGFRVARSSVR